MTDVAGYRRPPKGTQPEYLHPPYASTRKRAPTRPLILLPHTLSEVTGPLFGFSDTWQLVINTGTTIITFVMVFLIQHTQNRDTLALQLKLAELIIAADGAKNGLATIEDMDEEELEQLHETYRQRAEEALTHLHRRRENAHLRAS